MDEQMTAADHAFTAFLAGTGVERLSGEELRMFRFFEKHPEGTVFRDVEAEIAEYKKTRRGK